MKKIISSIACFISLTGLLIAQDNTAPVAPETTQPVEPVWKWENLFKLGFSQASFTNWVAGGDNSIAGITNFKSNLTFKKDKTLWISSLELGYGLSQQNKDKVKKSDDKIEFNTTYGHKATTHWYYSILGKFATQFDKGYANPADTIYSSKFMLPAKMLLTPGMEYASTDNNFKTFLSPIAFEATYISDTNYASMYGVDNGKYWYMGVGAFARIEYKAKLMENVALATKLDMFMDYRSKRFDRSTTFNWDFRIDMKINKFLTTSIATGLIYDPKTLFYEYDGSGEIIKAERKVQFKEVFMLNIVYAF